MKQWSNNSQLEQIIGEFVCRTGGYNNALYGDCNQINATTAFILNDMGYSVISVAGYVVVEKPEISEEGDEFYDPKHFWIERYDGTIADLANTQFEGNMNNFDLTRVEYYKTIEIEINNEWVDLEVVQLARKLDWYFNYKK